MTRGIFKVLKIVFPTTVGMNRMGITISSYQMSVPHDRGDEQQNAGLLEKFNECSPRPWG